MSFLGLTKYKFTLVPGCERRRCEDTSEFLYGAESIFKNERRWKIMNRSKKSKGESG